MSTELLMNFDKTVSNKINTESSSTNKNTTKDKKEGYSLFDSLMNEAKTESKFEEKTEVKSSKNTAESKYEAKSSKNTAESKYEAKSSVNTDESKFEEKTELKTNSKAVESKLENKDVVKNTVQMKDKISNENIESFKTIEKSDTNDNSSVKKMVEKLVDIVVNAAKEMFDKNNGELVDSKELKNAVEDIVDSKLNNIVDKDKLKSLIEKKLDIVKDSLNIINKETKNFMTSDNLDASDDLNTQETKKSKEIIQNEVIIIKDNVQEIKKDISLILNKTEPKLKDQKVNNKDSENSHDIDDNITSKIKNNLSIISDSTDEIKTIISGIDPSEKSDKTHDFLKEVPNKVEYKVETIKEAISEIKEKVYEIVIVKTTGEEIKKMESSSINIISNIKGKDNSEKPLLASMFLNAQKSIKDKTSLEQIHDAKKNITDKKSIESVKESAKKLDLNLEETEVNHEEEKGKKPISTEKKEELKTTNLINNRTLNRVLIDQKIEANNINMLRNNELTQKEIINNIENNKKIDNQVVEMTVPKDIAQNLQNKIIGAQQKMGSFMSEVARNMYLNYKPPVTAFRVNLNPANLGTISIMMKANKVDNSLSVSMNLSNSNTMEAFTENKLALQTAIQKQFNESSNVTINFNMQDQNSENEFSQFNQNSKENNQNQEPNGDSESNNMEEQEIIETNDYM